MDALVVAIVVARLLVPLAIPRWPLVIVVVLVLDALDQTLLATFTDVDTTETGPYQSVDKALDIYYLSIGYLATMRNWTSHPAFRIARFLLYYRLVGVRPSADSTLPGRFGFPRPSRLFELTDERLMLGSSSPTRSSSSSSPTSWRACATSPRASRAASGCSRPLP